MSQLKIGITERGDAGLDLSWLGQIDNVDGVIAITKAPHKLLEMVAILKNVIVHCTITGHGGTILEPGVAKPEITLDAAYRLVDILGPERVVLRIDPIIPTPKGIETARHILDRNWWGRIRVSFLDAYPHVRARFKAKRLPDLPWQGLHAPLELRKEALAELDSVYAGIEVCGEPGLRCSGCVSEKDLKTFGLTLKAEGKSQQRQACACLAAKTELLTQRQLCGHGCLYCYWQG